MPTYSEILQNELAKEANLKNLGDKKAPPFGSEKAPAASEPVAKTTVEGTVSQEKKASAEQPDPKLEKVAADMRGVKEVAEKIASVLEQDRSADDANLFRNCISAVAHMKLAGYIKDEFNDPQALNRLAYNMYRDIVAAL